MIRQIYHQLRQAVLEGRLAAGMIAFNSRLASQLNVARKTATLAYDLLFSEGSSPEDPAQVPSFGTMFLLRRKNILYANQ